MDDLFDFFASHVLSLTGGCLLLHARALMEYIIYLIMSQTESQEKWTY
jgi:hypothetical protein